ncbi:DEKNAAC102986 [Brettanomyces naardenensis]|uniref:DEKNAAC102986 n=1 Tax=Brettanomyces naardenensis TaxID=13370 RepID=A0A448YMA6_BRENA|nr:DEKNAAC102986 [Brettanomyces naardenensis]
MAIPWFIPHRRYLPEDLVAAGTTGIKDNTASADSAESLDKPDPVQVKTTGIGLFDSTEEDQPIAIIQDKYSESYKIKEFRDEAKRPWTKFFDEFEYRESKEESSRYDWWRWFRKGTSKEEKTLLIKLDVIIAFYSFLGYWIKFIDSSNLNNAYVSNMKEDLNMGGNDLINTQVIFSTGNVIFELPWMFLLPKVPLNYALFISELGWSIFTLTTYKAESVAGLQAMRFFVGSFEAAYFPIIHYILASWYLPSEVSRRGAVFYMGQFLGVLTSGLLQGAVFSNLNGRDGLAGWRWMFIIDGSISFAIAFLGLFCVPGTPFSCHSIFLSDDEIRIARNRMVANGTDPSLHSKGIFNKSKWKEAFSSWHVYLLSAINLLGFNTNSSSSGSFVLWLKSLNKYSIPKINNLSKLPPALGIVYILIICVGADITRKRFVFIILSFIMNFLGNFILALWNVPTAAKWFGFCSTYWSWSQSSVFNPMISDFFRQDNEVRAVAWMVIYIFGLQSSVWISRLVWPTVESPRFPKGFSTCAAFSLGFDLLLVFAYFLFKRDEKRAATKNGVFVYNSKTEKLEDALKEYQVTYLERE